MVSVFCALLDYSLKWRRKHLYDAHLPLSEIAKFERKDISLVNRQPSSIFRAHFEVYIGQKLFRAPAVSDVLSLPDSISVQGTFNLWVAIAWTYAAIEKVHRCVYGSYDCTDAVEYIFTP